MDIIKTKLQTQNTMSTCEKLEKLEKLESKIPNNNYNNTKQKQVPLNSFSTDFKPDCKPDHKIKYTNILSTVRIIHGEHGFFKGFFRGLTPRVMSNAPSCAVSWGTYEVVKHFLSSSRNYKS